MIKLNDFTNKKEENTIKDDTHKMNKHTTNEIVMVQPVGFKYNAETAVNNTYQNTSNENYRNVQEKALNEFNGLLNKLTNKGVKVNVLKDTPYPSTPDSIFPNNWFSTHEGGHLVLYPMFAENRNVEVDKFRNQVTEIMKKTVINKGRNLKIHDYRSLAEEKKILEGTGSMVIDRKNRTAYCSISPRANKDLFLEFCKNTDHKPVYFNAFQDGVPIYHTNVLMGIGEENAIVCLESIIDESERAKVRKELSINGKQIIEITLEQVRKFLGNTLELKGSDGKNFTAMSDSAYYSLTDYQKSQILESTNILHSNIGTIEYYGGGSVRCMMAEVFS